MSTLRDRIVRKLQSGGALPNVLVRSEFHSRPGGLIYQAKPTTPQPNLYPIFQQADPASGSSGGGQSDGEGGSLIPSYLQAKEILEGELVAEMTRINSIQDPTQKQELQTEIAYRANSAMVRLQSENDVLSEQLDKLGNNTKFGEISGEPVTINGAFLTQTEQGDYRLIPQQQLHVSTSENGHKIHFTNINGEPAQVDVITASKAIDRAYHDYNFIRFMKSADIPIASTIRSTTSYDSVADYIKQLGASGSIKISDGGTKVTINGEEVDSNVGTDGFSELSKRVFGLLSNDQKAQVYYRAISSSTDMETTLNNLVAFEFKLKDAKSVGATPANDATMYSIAVGGGGTSQVLQMQVLPPVDDTRDVAMTNIDVVAHPVKDVAARMSRKDYTFPAIPVVKAPYLTHLANTGDILRSITTMDGVNIADMLTEGTPIAHLGVDLADNVGNIVFLQGIPDETGDVKYRSSVQYTINAASIIFNENYKTWVEEYQEVSKETIQRMADVFLDDEDISPEDAKKKATRRVAETFTTDLTTFLSQKVKDVIIDGDGLVTAARKFSDTDPEAKKAAEAMRALLQRQDILTRPYIHTRFILPVDSDTREAFEKLKKEGHPVRIEEYDDKKDAMVLQGLSIADDGNIDAMVHFDGLMQGATDVSLFADEEGVVKKSEDIIKDLQIISKNMNTTIDFTSALPYLQLNKIDLDKIKS